MMGKIAFDALRDLRFRVDDRSASTATSPANSRPRLTIDGVALGQTGTQRLSSAGRCKTPVQVQCHDPRPVPRADRHRQELPRPAQRDPRGPARADRPDPRHRHRGPPPRGRASSRPRPRSTRRSRFHPAPRRTRTKASEANDPSHAKRLKIRSGGAVLLPADRELRHRPAARQADRDQPQRQDRAGSAGPPAARRRAADPRAIPTPSRRKPTGGDRASEAVLVLAGWRWRCSRRRAAPAQSLAGGRARLGPRARSASATTAISAMRVAAVAGGSAARSMRSTSGAARSTAELASPARRASPAKWASPPAASCSRSVAVGEAYMLGRQRVAAARGRASPRRSPTIAALSPRTARNRPRGRLT